MVTEMELKSALEQIDRLERELAELRARLMDKPKVERKPLEGLWAGTTFSEEEIDEAKQSWLKDDDA